MSTNNEARFEEFLGRYDGRDWARAIEALSGSIHEVDRAATRIWFAFYPLDLLRALEQAEDPEQLAKKLLLQGSYYLKEQVDTSHRFLYGHRYWPEVKKVVAEQAASFDPASGGQLAERIMEVAREASKRLKVEEALVVGISAVALMTVRQAGLAAFKAAPGTVSIDKKHLRKSPAQVLAERAKDDSQGFLGFLKTVDKVWSVTYDENDEGARFKVTNGEELASGAARDNSRDWRSVDPRCIEGPIPVECRAASCGTCWVGVIGGAEKLSEVNRLEGRMIKEFGYIETDEARPLIRLACMAQGGGAVSIVIPPWNGIFGKYLRARRNGETATQGSAAR
ncbi:MAG TPA: hypothetical protein VF723_17360 [Pyrinomonadaceae bacterium]|jgi:ferredoxin